MAILPSGLSDIVADEEDLARFIIQSSHLSAFMAKPAAFLPSPRDRETSVSRHGSEPSEGLWAIGLAAAGERCLYGAAIVKARVIRSVQLEVLADEPPPRHAVIRAWPWDEPDPEQQKAKQKLIAAIIASQAVLLRR
ncbi:MAG: hypothetical protein ABSH28_07820 [Acidobacteriota bacterium]|jgi:hypothetical protein